MIGTRTQQFKNFFQLILIFLSFCLPLNCHASDQDAGKGFHRSRALSPNGDESLIIEESGDNAEKPNVPEVAGNGSQYKDKPSDHPLPFVHRRVDVSMLLGANESVTEPIQENNMRPLDRRSQPLRLRTHEISFQKPSQLFMFLGKNYIGINDGRKVISNEDVQNFESAMFFYDPNKVSESQTFNWDSKEIFMSEMDGSFFNTSRTGKSLAVGIFGAAIGCISSTPATGTLVSSIGDFFHIPVGEGLSTGIVVWTLVTTTPCFATLLGKRFFIIANALFGQEAFSTRTKLQKALPHNRSLEDERKVESTPSLIETTTSHKAAIGLLIFASSLDATVNVGVVALAYLENFPGVFYGTSWAYFLSWMERYYTTGNAKIRRLICLEHDTELSHKKRFILLDSLQKGQQAIAQSDSFVNELYKKILSRINKDEEVGNQTLFALSAFFLQNSKTIPLPEDLNDTYEKLDEGSPLLDRRNIHDAKEKESQKEKVVLEKENITLMNFQLQQDNPHSFKEVFLDQLSTFLTGAAQVGRAVTMEYVLEQLLIHVLSMPAPVATGLSWTASIFDTLFRSFTESDAQKKYMRGWLNSFSIKHLGDFQWFRKTLGWTSIINGNGFALARAVAGIFAFQSWNAPIMLEIISLVPAFIQDQGYYGAFFEAGKDHLITNVATIRQPSNNDHINIKRAWLMKWSREIEELLTSQWDRETIGKLYTIILKGF